MGNTSMAQHMPYKVPCYLAHENWKEAREGYSVPSQPSGLCFQKEKMAVPRHACRNCQRPEGEDDWHHWEKELPVRPGSKGHGQQNHVYADC